MLQFRIIDFSRPEPPKIKFTFGGTQFTMNEENLRLALVNMELDGSGRSDLAKVYTEALNALFAYIDGKRKEG